LQIAIAVRCATISKTSLKHSENRSLKKLEHRVKDGINTGPLG
jgi:hypothetical protein